MPNDVMKPQTKKAMMCPPRTWDQAVHPPFGGDSIEVIRVILDATNDSSLGEQVSAELSDLGSSARTLDSCWLMPRIDVKEKLILFWVRIKLH